MESFHIGAVAALALLASSTAVVPAASQQGECAQVDKAPQVCGLTSQHISNLKKLVDQFQNENQRAAVPQDATANCVKVDNFKPTCGLTASQLAKVSGQIDVYKSQPAR